MSATPRTLKFPSSGPFILPADGGGPPPEVGEGTPGTVYRYIGDSADQTIPNAGPNPQNVNWLNYTQTVQADAPNFPHSIVGPCWLDVDMLLIFDSPIATFNVRPQLFLRPPGGGGGDLVRSWNQDGFGVSQVSSGQFNTPLLWIPAATTYDGFRVLLDAAADALDVILNNSNCHITFTRYIAPDAV